MARTDKTLEKILRGTSDPNIASNDLRQVLLRLKFNERLKGSPHIFTKEGVEEILNLQPKGAQENRIKSNKCAALFSSIN